MFSSSLVRVVGAVFALSSGGSNASDEGAQLAARLGPSYGVRASAHFLVIHSLEPTWASELVQVLEHGHDEFYRVFAQAGFSLRAPEDGLVWVYVNTRRELDEISREAERLDLSSLDGYYSTRSNRVVLVRLPETPVDVGRIIHELAHQLAFNSGLLERGVTYPLWVGEGLATDFEATVAPPSTRSDDLRARRGRVREARQSGTLVPLGRFVRLARVPDDDVPTIKGLYDEAWSLFQFLFRERHAALVGYLVALGSLRPGERTPTELYKEFVRAFGAIDPLERAWAEHIDQLD